MVDDGARGPVAEQLAFGFFMKRDAVPPRQGDEIVGSVTIQRRAGETRIVRQKPLRHRAGVGEVAAPTAGNQDFGARFRGMVKQQHATALWPAAMAHIRPAAPAPRMMTSWC